MSEIARLYRYKSLLSGRNAVSTAKLMAELEISHATFKRDIAKLRDQLHVPIVFDRNYGGYRIEQGSPENELPGLWFSQDELLALLTIQNMLSQLEPGLLGPKLKPLQLRLAVMLEKQGLSEADAKAENGNPAIKMQNDKCCMLRDQILQFLTNHPELGEDEESGFNHAKTILNRLHYLENSFKFDQKECTLEQVDRTVSMFSGPLYCSDKYPQARDKAGNPMFPILQIDLRWINEHCQKNFPVGLLQLWLDTKWSEHVLRVIPIGEVSLQSAVPFDWGTLHQISKKRTAQRSAPWPCDPTTQLLVGVIPVGMSCPDISSALFDDFESIPGELVRKIDELESAMLPVFGTTHLFGAFYAPQMDPGYFLPYKLFLTLVEWGDEGRAQIHYLTEANGNTLFKFSHCAG
jgi:biotin operon repressor